MTSLLNQDRPRVDPGSIRSRSWIIPWSIPRAPKALKPPPPPTRHIFSYHALGRVGICWPSRIELINGCMRVHIVTTSQTKSAQAGHKSATSCHCFCGELVRRPLFARVFIVSFVVKSPRPHALQHPSGASSSFVSLCLGWRRFQCDVD